MKLSVHLLTWNGAKYIPFLFDSLRKQTFRDWRLVVLDNASTDETVADCRLQIAPQRRGPVICGANFPVEVEVIENKENVGFARGHNQLISDFRFQISDFILLLNQDMYLLPDCIEKLVNFMDKNEDAAVVSPRLMRWDFKNTDLDRYNTDIDRLQIGQIDTNLLQESFTNQIDSLGLRVFRNRRVVEKYAGKDWSAVKPKMELSFRSASEAKEVFGVSGALPMFRRKVIDEVGLPPHLPEVSWSITAGMSGSKFGSLMQDQSQAGRCGGVFDESFGSYKEDVDLAFRLRSAGYKAYVLLDAVAYHDRTAVGLEKMGDKVAIENKKKQSDLVRYNSYRNHLIVLYKNEYWQNFLLDFPWILWYEGKKFLYFLLFDRKVLRGWREVWGMRDKLKIERMKIKRFRRVGWREMRRWW